MRRLFVAVLAITLLVPQTVTAGPCSRLYRFVKRAALLGLGAGAGYYVAEKELWTETNEEACSGSDKPTNGKAPTIVVYGDSLSSGFPGYTSLPEMVFISRTTHHGWPIGGPDSLCGRIAQRYPGNAVHVWNLASGAAYIDPAPLQTPASKRIVARIHDLSKQVDEAVAAENFPRLHVFLIGHNNLDWKSDLNEFHFEEKAYLAQLPGQISLSYEAQLRRVLERARGSQERVDIVVYGLAPMRYAIPNVAAATAEHERDPSKFPYVGEIAIRVPSFTAEHEKVTLDLEERTNAAFEGMVGRLQKEIAADPALREVRLHYSKTVNESKFDQPKYFSPLDAFHPSAEGRAAFSKLVYDDLETRGLLQPLTERP